MPSMYSSSISHERGIGVELKEQRPHERIAVVRAVPRLGVDVRQQSIAQLDRAAEVVRERLVIFPRLARRGAVAARVRGERQTAASGDTNRAAPCHESADVVAPVGEAGESERQTAAQRGGHGGIGVLGVAAPVERIALAAGPGAAGPDDVVAGDLFGDIGHGLVVAQRIKIVLVPTGAARGIHAVERRVLAEIDLDRADVQLQAAR